MLVGNPNQSASSRAADSGESEPCTRFCCTLRPQSRARSPRIVPGAAAVGSVAPPSARHPSITRFPRPPNRNTRARLHKFDERLVEGLALVFGIVLRKQ